MIPINRHLDEPPSGRTERHINWLCSSPFASLSLLSVFPPSPLPHPSPRNRESRALLTKSAVRVAPVVPPQLQLRPLAPTWALRREAVVEALLVLVLTHR